MREDLLRMSSYQDKRIDVRKIGYRFYQTTYIYRICIFVYILCILQKLSIIEIEFFFGNNESK